MTKIDQAHRPLAAMLLTQDHPIHPEKMLLTFNSGFKFKLYNSTTRLCRKTVLGPVFSGNLKDIKIVPNSNGQEYIAYSSSSKVIGITKLPLDGNPHRSMGLIGHPREVSNLVATNNGAALITAGGSDCTVYLWGINYAILESQIQFAGDGLIPFLNMLDETGKGANGPAYRELEDYFYYAQLRSQGENASKDRQIKETVPLKEVPLIMQAMGFYASQQEIEDLMNEVKYSRYTEAKGDPADAVTFDELIKCKKQNFSAQSWRCCLKD
jgi:hypothetical protein